MSDIFRVMVQGYGADLYRALRHDALLRYQKTAELDREVLLGAIALARAIGRCRLYGIEIDEQVDGTVPLPLALAACDQFCVQLARWAERVDQLSKRWDQAECSVEAEDLCGGLLAARMDAWAIWIALDESLHQLVRHKAAMERSMLSAIDRVSRALIEFDLKLRSHAELLSTVAGTGLLVNWRSCIAQPYASALPWWLDGTLEQLSSNAVEQMIQTLPRSVAAGI